MSTNEQVHAIARPLAALLAAAFFALAGNAAAATRYAGCGSAHSPNTATVAAAISAAAAGDTILICAGTYAESLTVDRQLTIGTVSGANDVTINGGAGNAITLANQTSPGTLTPKIITLQYLSLNSSAGYGVFGNSISGSGIGTYTFTGLTINSALDAVNLNNPNGVTMSATSLTSSAGAGLVIGANASGTYSISNTGVVSHTVGISLGGSASSTKTHTLSNITVDNSAGSGDAIDVSSGAVTVSTATIKTTGIGINVSAASTLKSAFSSIGINSNGSGIVLGAGAGGAHTFNSATITCTSSGCNGIWAVGGATFDALIIYSAGDAIFIDHTNGNNQTYGSLTLNSSAGLGINIRNSGTASSQLSFGAAGTPISITSAAGGIYIGDNVSSNGTISFNNLALVNNSGSGIQTGPLVLGNLSVGSSTAASITNMDASAYAFYASAGNNVTLSQLTISSSGGGIWLDSGVTGNLSLTGTINQTMNVTASGSGAYGLYVASANNAVLSDFTLSVPAGYGIYAGSAASVGSILNFNVSSNFTALAIAVANNSLTLQNGVVTATGSTADAVDLGQTGTCSNPNNLTLKNLNLTPGTGGRGLSVQCGNSVSVSAVCTKQGTLGMYFAPNSGRISIATSNLSDYTTAGIELDTTTTGGGDNGNTRVQSSCFQTATVPMAASPVVSGNNNSQWSGNFWKGVSGSRYQPGGAFSGVSSYTNGLLDNNIITSCPATTASCFTASAAATPAGDWYFDDVLWSGTSADVKDAVAANAGTAHGAAQEVANGRICWAGSFDGATAYITIPYISAYSASAGMSFSVWVNPASTASATIFQSGNGNSIGLDSHNGFYAQFSVNGNYGNGGSNTVSAGVLPALNTWYHLVSVYDGARVYLYINGVLAGSSSAPGNLNNNNNGLVIGAGSGGGDNGGGNYQNFFSGLIDEPIFFAGALTAAQVQTGYSNQSSGLNWDGSARTCPSGSPGPTVGAFGAYETATSPASAYTGNINTKVSGRSYTLDVAALNSAKTSVSTSFSGSVLVQVVGSPSATPTLDSYGCPATGAQVLASPGTVSLSGGRSTISFPAEPNAWRYAKVKVSYPTASPSVISCSGDAFAIRPASLSVVANDSACLGPACYLNSSATTGAPIHAAGASFSITASAYNGASVPALTTNYPGAGVTLTPMSLAVVAPAGVLGTLAPGSFAGSGGSITSSSAVYSEAGSLTAQFVDQTFATVDAVESATPASGISSPVTAASCSGYYVCSGTTTIGRFVPDHFAVTAKAPLAACTAFTYFGQDFSTPFTLTAQNASNVATQNYAGTLAKLNLASWSSFAFSASGSPAGSALASGTAAPTGTWIAGSASISASQNLSVPANPAPPSSVTILAKPVDTDGVTMPSATAVTSVAALLYQGRARMSNAIGPETWDLAVPFRVEYWQSALAGWQLNTADACTTASVHITSGTLPAADTCVRDSGNPGSSGAGCSAAAAIASHKYQDASSGFAGNFNLWLAGSGAGNRGTVNLSATVPPWLQYNWNGSLGNPSAIATFGMTKPDPVLYRTERY